jgi:thiol-disulfide isomerase/thioredoxin
MQITTRRAVLAATATAAAGTLAAASLWRKPAPHIFTLAQAQTAELQPLAGVEPAAKPIAPADIPFLDGDGTPHHLAEFAGKGLVLNLWATWCVPCVAEMPALAAMAQAVAGERIAVLPLSSDRGGAQVVRKFYAQHDIQALQVWLDPKGEAARGWGARGLPTTLILDRQGREVARLEGAVDWSGAASLAELRRLVG